MKQQELNLLAAFPAMPDHCRAALSSAARSAKDEETVKRKYPVALLAAALLTLITTIAIAEGWNVLAFLGIQPDSDAQTLVQPLSLSASADNVTFSIESAICDGEFLIFDWTVTNADPSRPVYISRENFTANNAAYLYNISSLDFDDQWLPGFTNPATSQGGCIAPLAKWLQQEDTLHIELTIAVHTAVNPVHFMEANHFDEALNLLNEGYAVIIGNDRYALFSDSDIPGAIGIAVASGVAPGGSIPGTQRSEITLAFDLDMKASMTTSAAIDTPIAVSNSNATLTLDQFTVTPLQVYIQATATWHEGAAPGLTGKFLLRDQAGNTLHIRDLSASSQSFMESLGRMDMEGVKHTEWECSLISPILPEEVSLVLKMTDGTELSIPLKP